MAKVVRASAQRRFARVVREEYMDRFEGRLDAWTKALHEAEKAIREARAGLVATADGVRGESGELRRQLGQLLEATEGIWREASETVGVVLARVREAVQGEPATGSGNGRRRSRVETTA